MSTTPPPPPPGEGPPGDEQPAEPGSAPPPPPPPPPTAETPPPPQTAYGAPSYSSAPPPAPGPAPTGVRPGELLDRFLARLIDHILLAVVNTIIVTVIVVGALLGESATAFGTGSTFLASAIAAVVSAAIALGYFGYLESTRGQTVGKMIMKLRTVGPDGGNPTMEQALRRNIYLAAGLIGIIPVIGIIGGLVSLAAMIMIAVTINSDSVNRQGWHDHFAGETRVLKIG